MESRAEKEFLSKRKEKKSLYLFNFLIFNFAFRKFVFVFSFLKSDTCNRKKSCFVCKRLKSRVLKSPKSGFRFVKKTPKSRLYSSLLTFFRFSLLIRDFLLKIHPKNPFLQVYLLRPSKCQELAGTCKTLV